MRSIAYALPSLPGFAGLKTYAAWPVWRDSTTDEVKFQPLPKKEAARRWHKARRFDRQTHLPGKHGGAIGRRAGKSHIHMRGQPPTLLGAIAPHRIIDAGHGDA